MVSKIRYLWKNLIDQKIGDGIGLDASSEVETLPVENIQHPFRTLPWRTGELVNNPLLNAGFEDGEIGQQPSEWEKNYDGDGGSTFLTQAGGSEGSKEAQLIIGGTDTFVSCRQYWYPGVMKKGQRYLLKAKFKCADACSGIFQLREDVGGTGRNRSYYFNLDGGSEWEELMVDLVVADYANTRLSATIRLSTTGVTLKIDDIRLYRYESVIINLWWYAQQPVKAFAAINHNLESGAEILFMANYPDNWEGTAGQVPGYGLPVREVLSYDSNIIIKHFAEEIYKYWRFEVLNPTNADGYLEFGRLYLGNYFEPSKNFVYNWEYGLVDPSEIDESESGQEYANIKEQYRIIKVAFTEGAPLIDVEKEYYEEMLAYCGRHRDLFLSLDYENKPNKWSFYGKFANTNFNFREFEKGYFSTGFDFKEAR